MAAGELLFKVIQSLTVIIDTVQSVLITAVTIRYFYSVTVQYEANMTSDRAVSFEQSVTVALQYY